MYAEFFGLRELPFNNTPDPRFFYSTPDHEEALASLIYAVQERKGFVLLTGEVGAGKTLVSRMMLRHFGDRIVFADIHHAVHGADDLMESVAHEFELHTTPRAGHAQRVRALHDFLLEQFSRNTPAVLVLDEAQNLPVDAFEQLRMIGNLEADDAKLLQIVIVGQPELQRLFASKELRQLRQRIFRAFHLPGLNRRTIEEYIRHRLAVAGGGGEQAFEPSALDTIFRHSRGLPRLINGICDNCLLSAYSADRRQINGPFVETVVAQMMTIGHPTKTEELQEAKGTRQEEIAQRPKCLTGTGSRLRNSQFAIRNSQSPGPAALPDPYQALARRAAAIEARLRGMVSPATARAMASGPGARAAQNALLNRVPKGTAIRSIPASTVLADRLNELCTRLTRVVSDVRSLVTTIGMDELRPPQDLSRLRALAKLAKPSGLSAPSSNSPLAV